MRKQMALAIGYTCLLAACSSDPSKSNHAVTASGNGVTFTQIDDSEGSYAGTFTTSDPSHPTVSFSITNEDDISFSVGPVLGTQNITENPSLIASSVDANAYIQDPPDQSVVDQASAFATDGSQDAIDAAENALISIVANPGVVEGLNAVLGNPQNYTNATWRRKCRRDLAACEAACIAAGGGRAAIARCTARCLVTWAACKKRCPKPEM
jgi:hypothetical protein